MFLANTINILKSSQKNNRFSCSVPYSNSILSFLKCLNLNGLINGFVVKNKIVLVFLRYDKKGNGLLNNMSIYSRGGKRKFVSANKTYKTINFVSGCVISSTIGFFISFCTGSTSNLKGGEIICKF